LSIDLTAAPPPPSWGVAIDDGAVGALADRWREEAFPLPTWDYEGLPRGLGDEEWFEYCGYAVSILACLWPPEGEETWRTELAGRWLDDAPGLFACFTRALDRGRLPLERFASWNDGDMESFFAGRGKLQLVHERGARLHAIARTLPDAGGFAALVEESGLHVPSLAELLVARVPGYRDEVRTELGFLRFDKLANLAAAMMAATSARSWSGLDELPVYPDYMLPRVLRHLGILRYVPALATKVDSRRLIPAGSQHEAAIRWATIHAGERLRRALNARGNPVIPATLDYRLWWLGVLSPEADCFGEHHRTVTLAY